MDNDTIGLIQTVVTSIDFMSTNKDIYILLIDKETKQLSVTNPKM